MKVKYVVYAILVIAVIVLIAYLFNMFQLRMEQAIGKFFTWTVIFLLMFAAGWVVGRFGGRKKGSISQSYITCITHIT